MLLSRTVFEDAPPELISEATKTNVKKANGLRSCSRWCIFYSISFLKYNRRSNSSTLSFGVRYWLLEQRLLNFHITVATNKHRRQADHSTISRDLRGVNRYWQYQSISIRKTCESKNVKTKRFWFSVSFLLLFYHSQLKAAFLGFFSGCVVFVFGSGVGEGVGVFSSSRWSNFTTYP